MRTDFCENAFRHLDELDKRSNSTIYIGPGATGESDDKIRLDLKFEPKTSRVTVPSNWADKGIVKTTYILVVNRSVSRSIGRYWTLLEEQVPLDNHTAIEDVIESLRNSDGDDLYVAKMICILHPYVDDPAGFKDDMEEPVNHTAHVTYQDVPESVAAWNGDDLSLIHI